MVVINLALEKLHGKNQEDILEYVASDMPVLMTKQAEEVDYADCEYRDECYKIDTEKITSEKFLLRKNGC